MNRLSFVMDESNRAVGISGFGTDFTELKRTFSFSPIDDDSATGIKTGKITVDCRANSETVTIEHPIKILDDG